MLFSKHLNNNVDVEIGGPRDVCFYCIADYIKEHPNASSIVARAMLQKKLEYKKIYKNKRVNLVICSDHIKKINSQINEEEVSENE